MKKRVIITLIFSILIFVLVAISFASASSIRCNDDKDCDHNQLCVYAGTQDSYCRERYTPQYYDMDYRYSHMNYYDYHYMMRSFCGDGFCNVNEQSWCVTDCSPRDIPQFTKTTQQIQPTQPNPIIVYVPQTVQPQQVSNQFLIDTTTLKWGIIGLIILFIFLLLIAMVILILR